MQNFVLMENSYAKVWLGYRKLFITCISSNLYMEVFEKNLLTIILPIYVKRFRCVDDVICLWPKSMNLWSSLHDLNNFVSSIKFSVEVEQQNCLPFLDVFIVRKEDDFYSMFTESQRILCSYIHFNSNHSINVKIATFSVMF